MNSLKTVFISLIHLGSHKNVGCAWQLRNPSDQDGVSPIFSLPKFKNKMLKKFP